MRSMQKYSITSRRLLITFGVLSACVLSACPSGEAPPGTCQSNGKSYDVEEEFWDECNRCTCKGDGVVSCTDKLCGHSDSCSYNGKQYPAGASFPAGDGCNTCGCTDDGQVACTLIACPPVKSCSYNGTLYPVGSAFPADDGDLSRLVLGQGYEVREDREDFLRLKPEVADVEERRVSVIGRTQVIHRSLLSGRAGTRLIDGERSAQAKMDHSIHGDSLNLEHRDDSVVARAAV